MLELARRLKQAGVLGLNGRNALYQLVYNERKNYPLVDDKVLTKQIAQKIGMAVPTLYGLIEDPHQVDAIDQIIDPYNDFVIKPAQGSGGDGILVFVGRGHGLFRLANGRLMDIEDIRFHVHNILSGIYSLGGQDDKALIEYRVKFDPVFERIAYQGVPDVRIIVFLGVPVMAMVRLPTRMSGGRANLHQGCIGAGVDMRTGKTLSAVLKNSIVEEHPDTGAPVRGVQIPNWDKLLEIAAQSFEMTGLGYQGIDLVLDSERGPLMLELNARPGLNIQIANGEGLNNRLELIKANIDKLSSLADRVAFARENFPPKI
ncbi:MAG: alpha-L-glutamate ligase-like protein [Rhodospirillales bacterium]